MQQPGDQLQFFGAGSGTGGGASSYGYAATAQSTYAPPNGAMMFNQQPGPSASSASSAQYAQSQSQNRVYVGSPFGTGGYSDEPPLCEGKFRPVIEISRKKTLTVGWKSQSWASISRIFTARYARAYTVPSRAHRDACNYNPIGILITI